MQVALTTQCATSQIVLRKIFGSPATAAGLHIYQSGTELTVYVIVVSHLGGMLQSRAGGGGTVNQIHPD